MIKSIKSIFLFFIFLNFFLSLLFFYIFYFFILKKFLYYFFFYCLFYIFLFNFYFYLFIFIYFYSFFIFLKKIYHYYYQWLFCYRWSIDRDLPFRASSVLRDYETFSAPCLPQWAQHLLRISYGNATQISTQNQL